MNVPTDPPQPDTEPDESVERPVVRRGPSRRRFFCLGIVAVILALCVGLPLCLVVQLTGAIFAPSSASAPVVSGTSVPASTATPTGPITGVCGKLSGQVVPKTPHASPWYQDKDTGQMKIWPEFAFGDHSNDPEHFTGFERNGFCQTDWVSPMVGEFWWQIPVSLMPAATPAK